MNYIRVTDVENSVNFQFENTKADGCLLSDLQGFEDSVAINVIEDVASPIGAVGVNTKSGRRILTFTARFTCDVLDQRRDMLAALRRTGFLKLIEFETVDGLDLQCMAFFDKLNAPYSAALNKPMLVQFSAPDPRLYSQTLHTTTVSRNSTGVVTNAGNEVTNPIFRINGPISTASITNLNNGDQIDITYSLGSGEYIDIDALNQTIKLDDGTPIYSAADGTPEFPTLDPGANSIQFADTGGSGTTDLDVIFRDAYNGV